MKHTTSIGALLSTAMISAPTVAAAADADLLTHACSNGAVTVTAKAPWHTNPGAPWAWDKGSVVSKDQNQVKLKGAKCEGTVRAFIANGAQSKGPISIAIK